MSRPDGAALELVLPSFAAMGGLSPELLVPGRLPELWDGDEITEESFVTYFGGSTTVQVVKNR